MDFNFCKYFFNIKKLTKNQIYFFHKKYNLKNIRRKRCRRLTNMKFIVLLKIPM